MAKWMMGGKVRELLLSFAAGAALLLASLANFINHNDYPYLRGEVALVALGLLAVSAVMAPLYVGQRRWGRSVLEGLLTALFLDLNTDSVVLASVVGLAVGLFTFWLRFSLIGPMAMLGSVIAVTTMLGVGGNPNWIKVQKGAQADSINAKAAGKPAILHLILDEHIGIEGLSNEGVEGRQLRDELRDFYRANGFAVYGRAYSRHFNTGNAIAEILNYGEKVALNSSKKHVETGSTEYLRTLVDHGYRLTIFQSDYVDFCNRSKFHECITYDSSSLRPTLVAPIDTKSRAGLLAYKFLALSDLFTSASNGWNGIALALRRSDWALPMFSPGSARSSSVATLEALNELSGRIKLIRPGEAIFAHVLLPHYPYVVTRNCDYLPAAEWEERFSNSESTIQMRRRASYEQIRCTTRRLQALLRTLSQAPARSNTVVVIHGDHGSRIARLDPNEAHLGKYSDVDLLAGFSTLFAVRTPDAQAGYFKEPQPVSLLLHDFAASGFRSAPHPTPPDTPSVFLADGNWKPVRRVPLPPSWTKAE